MDNTADACSSLRVRAWPYSSCSVWQTHVATVTCVDVHLLNEMTKQCRLQTVSSILYSSGLIGIGDLAD